MLGTAVRGFGAGPAHRGPPRPRERPGGNRTVPGNAHGFPVFALLIWQSRSLFSALFTVKHFLTTERFTGGAGKGGKRRRLRYFLWKPRSCREFSCSVGTRRTGGPRYLPAF